MTAETDSWNDTLHILIRTNWWFFIFEGITLTLASLVLLIGIIKSPKREKDPLYIVIVFFMVLYGIFETPLNAVFLLNEL